MISEQKIKYDDLRASEEALLASDEFQLPLPLTSRSQRWRIIESIFQAFNDAHWKMLCRFAAVQVLLIAVYTIAFVTLRSNICQIDKTALIPSPARPAIRMERRTLHNSVNATNPYKGRPSEELDLAWHNLLRHGNIRLSAQELREMGKMSVELADGSGEYIGALDVYHQLHCLKYIRHYIYSDYYPIKKTNVPSLDHVDHCIDSLRQLLMCRSDVAIQTYSWIPTLRIPWANFETEHECQNWETLDGWASQRAFDLYDPKMLRHPTLGTSFPPGWAEQQKTEDGGNVS